MVKSFIPWVGGKTRAAKRIVELIPPINNYWEPFLGGGSVFFELMNQQKISGQIKLSDIIDELIVSYIAIRDNPYGVYQTLIKEKRTKEEYYALRKEIYKYMLPHQAASRLIYLMKLCYNGLYRVNKGGDFNVPLDENKLKTRKFPTEEELTECSQALMNADIFTASYEKTLAILFEEYEIAEEKTFVYLDPPYWNMYSSYSSNKFNKVDHRILALQCQKLNDRGIQFMLSNIDIPAVRELYRDFKIESIEVTHSVSRNADGRKPKKEVLVMNY